MTIIYELNPPKVIQGTVLSHQELEDSVNKLKERSSVLTRHCDGMHITDSVLGIPRISPVTTGAFIRGSNKEIEITTSLRVRDRNLTSLIQSVCDSILLNLNGVLILKGDPPPKGPQDSKLIPSDVVKQLNSEGFGKKIDLFLSISQNPDFDKIHKKIEAEPKGFITQVISSIENVTRIVDKLKPDGFRIIPCILLPSVKNSSSAKMLNLDWSEYKDNFTNFIKTVHSITGNVLLSSPNDFHSALEILKRLN